MTQLRSVVRVVVHAEIAVFAGRAAPTRETMRAGQTKRSEWGETIGSTTVTLNPGANHAQTAAHAVRGASRAW
ncbi:hypothetical protein [Paraburkholderia humisilvae]|uniref:Uncharacterized protein n=1 Tax=Paraburkholderia humisilvae TaxID=627669 RepID=A0A6J5EJX7_9BURK|nr:hypothetical protein [Paraburkholderia humisilvae]CAB3766808.1 hypothetical protein LMG29542_05438 [Paraburkholderia humisilvae]